jgi:hypothetical protein
MYVIGKVEVEESISTLSLEQPEVDFSIEEFERYADLFEEMLERMDREETEGREEEHSVILDEFDMAEIAYMRERFGLTLED